ncbi:MAG: endonuclease III [Muribaculaceae bacterium]|nr:endonuclease III [Muribaculaceae bacterium]
MTLKQRYDEALRYFSEVMPEPHTELHFDTPFQLLVAVILSAQCTDKRVNMITPALFEAYPTAGDMAKATPEEILPYIASVSYPNNKAKSLAGMARMLHDEFNDQVPDSMDQLLKIPGVGRKTANVILSVVFGKAAMAVDTHVFRVAERIGLTTGSTSPLATEQTLMKHIPENLVGKAHHWLILHGRYTCKARKPECGTCGLAPACRYYQKNQHEVR